jgi:hypothetical protein
VPRELLTRKNNNIKFDKVESNILTLEDERNNDELKYISTFNNVFYKGLYPGVGKTTACSMFEGEKLFITPYNKLCQQLRIKYNNSKAITFNKLFGLNISDEKNYKTKDYNLEGVKCIIFDEVLLYNVRRLQKIKKFMNEHKEIRFLFSGDCDQRKPIEFGCNNVDLKTYQMNCMRVICNNEVILSVPKRLKTEEDIRKMMQLKQDIFNNKLNVIETLKKNGFKIINNIKDVKTHKNICYFNYRANNIINNILGKIAIPQEAKEINGLKYWVGLELICKKSQKITNKIKSYVNYSYEIIKIDDDKITLLNREDNEEFKITNNQLYYFNHPYCMTCDSAQGLTIEEEYTIFDCNIPYTDREFVWTALTRGTDFKNITIFEHNEEEIKRLTISRLIQYFNMKVMNYKKQDEKASREITEDYINSNWIIDQFEKNKICPICFNNLFINIDDDNIIISNITVDRIDNKISHTKNNCRLMCCFCNCSKH